MKIFLALFLIFSCTQLIAIEPFEFKNRKDEQLYQELAESFRCMVCQNQSLAGSNVTLAKNLKKIIADLVNQGKTEAEITQYMADRYGDSILYKPPLRMDTLILWMAPLIILLIAGTVLFFKIRQTKHE